MRVRVSQAAVCFSFSPLFFPSPSADQSEPKVNDTEMGIFDGPPLTLGQPSRPPVRVMTGHGKQFFRLPLLDPPAISRHELVSAQFINVQGKRSFARRCSYLITLRDCESLASQLWKLFYWKILLLVILFVKLIRIDIIKAHKYLQIVKLIKES